MQILTNIQNLELLDDFNGKLLNGKIKVSSNRGYPSDKTKKQQDAVGSAVKNDDYFINIVADGIGSNHISEKASATIVLELIKWFEKLSEEILNNIDILIQLLKKQIYLINKDIYLSYGGKALTTFVLALTTNNHTIVANIGDSTAYAYQNDEDYPLELLTVIDSWSSSKYYEDVRYSSFNNVVTACIGDRYEDKIHINIIKNKGQKIILSTDGVTDLISEERFIDYFVNDTDAKTIVNDALTTPDTEYLNKKEDNISVITIELPSKTLKKEKVKYIK